MLESNCPSKLHPVVPVPGVFGHEDRETEPAPAGTDSKMKFTVTCVAPGGRMNSQESSPDADQVWAFITYPSGKVDSPVVPVPIGNSTN